MIIFVTQKNNPMKKITLFLAAALCIATTYAQNSLNLQKGQKYLVENKVTTVSNTEVQGQNMETNVNVTTNYHVEVTDVTPTTIMLNNTVSKMLMTMNMMGQDMNFDSEKKEDLDGPIGSSLKDVIMKPVSVTLEKSGKVVPAKKDTAKKDMSPMAMQFGDFEAQGYGSELTFLPLPANLKAGSTWTANSTSGSTKKTTNYMVKSITGNMATLAIDGTMDVTMEMEQQGMQMTTKTKGKFTGSEIVDTKTGVIQSNTTTVSTDGTIEVMGQEIPTSAKTTSTTTVKVME